MWTIPVAGENPLPEICKSESELDGENFDAHK